MGRRERQRAISSKLSRTRPTCAPPPGSSSSTATTWTTPLMTRLIRSDAGRHTRDAENDDGATIAPPEAAPRAGLTPAVVLALQRSAGNAAVARLLAGGEPSRAAPGRARVQ